jgi:initiation factor 1A
MVKNNTGGNKAKRQGRRFATEQQGSNKGVRKASEVGEIYAAVTKIFGGSTCEVKCNDGLIRQCVIRGKFAFKGKRENTLISGIWVLVGLRDWEVRASGLPRCDLLEVYSSMEKEKLRQAESCSFQHILGAGESTKTDEHDLFSDLTTTNLPKKVSGAVIDEDIGIGISSDDEPVSDSDTVREKENPLPNPLPPPTVLLGKEAVRNQLDWMTINIDDI